MSMENPNLPGGPLSGIVASAVEYMADAGQRSVLFLDIMRQRGDQYREHVAQTAPHVLSYEAELIIDGRKLEQPVNYALVRIIPPKGVEVDLKRRPFIVVDPRAGHGPGIGGFKADSEIGVAMKAGHPCYFIGFLPEPMPGQTIERIARAEAIFIEKVIERHPDADGKPCVIGNCQAGWAIMILASLRPELFGPLIIAGAPLAYWAGVHGKYPMRYSGGLLGGTGMALLSLGLVLLAVLPPHPSQLDIVWRMALCGVGYGLFQSPNNHTSITAAPPHRSGGASGMLGTARLTGQTLGAVLLAMIFAMFDPQGGHGSFVALWLAAGFAALAGICSALRMRQP